MKALFLLFAMATLTGVPSRASASSAVVNLTITYPDHEEKKFSIPFWSDKPDHSEHLNTKTDSQCFLDPQWKDSKLISAFVRCSKMIGNKIYSYESMAACGSSQSGLRVIEMTEKKKVAESATLIIFSCD